VKTFILILLSALLFLGNVGVPVFTHACEEDGVFTSFFIQQENHCQEGKEVSKLPPCCQEEKKNNCCSDEKTIVQLDEKYVVTHGLSIPTFHFLYTDNQYFPSYGVIPHSEVASIQTWDDPPPIQKFGKELLIQHCTFRI
jgi:hypothetical protein